MRRRWNQFEKTSRHLGLSRRLSGCFFEQLEDRCLLSISPGLDYEHVASDWFDTKVDPVVAVASSLDFIGPLTLAEFEARSALFSNGPVAEALQEQSEEQWIVRLTPEATSVVSDMDDAEALLNTSAVEFRVVRGLGLPGQLLVEAPEASAQEVRVALQSNPLVAYFGSNGSVSGQVVPDDTDFDQLWALNNSGQTGGTADADIDAPEAWDITTGSANVVVAVIDSGIDYTHPDLYKNIWLNQGEIPAALLGVLVDTDSDGLITFYDLNESANATYVTDSNATGYIDAEDLLADANWADTVDGDGNGKADDLVGWNFSGTGTGNEPLDGSRHGTHVAGTIGATGNNATGTTGVAWQVSIMPLKFLDDSNRGTTGEAILAINYATMMRETYGVNVVVANNSWGYRGDSDANLRAAIEANGAADILFVAASGNGDILGHGVDNDEDPELAFYPASEDLDSVLSVAASNDDDQLARFSNYGATSVDIAAPGVSIFSTEPDGDYRSRYGTSMAAPHVSGAAALIWSSVSDATAAEVKEAILLGGDPISELQDKIASGKRLNAYGALLVDTAAPRVTLIDAPNVDGPGVTETVITVEYRDDRLVDRASVLASELLITDLVDSSTTYTATFQSVDVTEDSRVCTATYLLSAPAGAWATFDNGDYEVSLQGSQVADSSFNWTPTTSLGTFNVDTTPGLIRVTSFDDGLEAGTLRAAVIAANTDTATVNVIRLSAGQYTLSISGREEDAAVMGDLDVTHDLTIRGAGADLTTIDAAALDRAFHVLSGVTVELQDVTFTGGNPQAEGGGILNESTLTLTRCQIAASTATSGGALSNASGAVATINASTLYNNLADNGGAIDNQGTLTLVNSTISGNEATAGGGGIRNQSGAATLTNVTIAANTAAAGGGIHSSATATLLNTIVANNSATTDADFSGTADSLGTNLIGEVGTSTGWIVTDLLDTDPLLGPLQDNTGTTLTHALLVDSPAIDAGTDTDASAEDQRDIARPADGNQDDIDTTDIGAVERYYGEIHGILFQDDNPNGIREIREPGLADRIVFLDSNDNGQLDTGDPLTTTATDDPGTADVNESGTYTFSNVEPGQYRVVPLLDNGWDEVFREPQPNIDRVSNSYDIVQEQAEFGGESGAISADGRYVAFRSGSEDLVPGDTNGRYDIFVCDQYTGAIERVSVSSDGSQADSHSEQASVSADGRYVVFTSDATNLVTGDTNLSDDVFVHDRQLGVTERVSVAYDGGQPNGCSGNATSSSATARSPAISADGRYVTFASEASNLVPDDTNHCDDVFVFDRKTGLTERVSVASDGTQANGDSSYASISADGRYVAFISNASNLLVNITKGYYDVFVHDRQAKTTERVSVASDGTPASGFCFETAISADGRYVAFESWASNLVPDDNNYKRDVFVHDRQARITERVSVASSGIEANGDSYCPVVSADGQYVAFYSDASNLVVGDTNDQSDVFIYDRQNGTTERLSEASDGVQANGASSVDGISGDGQIVVLSSWATNLVPNDTNGYCDVFVHDRNTGTTERKSIAANVVQGNKNSYDGSISADGQYIAFVASSSNLVDGDTNDSKDIFVRDCRTEATERVSIASDGAQGNGGSDAPTISANGRYVVFESSASNLVPGDTNSCDDIFIHDRQMGTTERISIASDGTQANDYSRDPVISANGRYVAFESFASNLVAGITNTALDIYVHDRQTRTTERISVTDDDTEVTDNCYEVSISADGRYVAFATYAPIFVAGDTNGTDDIYLYDRQAGVFERISVANDDSNANSASRAPSITADGRYVAFESFATNLIADDTNNEWDVFVRDRQTGVTELVSLGYDGSQANQSSFDTSVSADGRYITFRSWATNLVPGDTNFQYDIFTHDRETGITERVSIASDGTQSNDWCSRPSMSADGHYIVFDTGADTLVPGDTNGYTDIFVATNVTAWQQGTVTAHVGVGESVGSMESGIRPLPGGIAGQVFRDLNRDGVQDPDELGQSGWTVFLDLDDNGVLDEGEPSTVTGSFGDYAFSELEPYRTYTVTVVEKGYWIQTLANQTAGATWFVQITAGALADAIDFGFYYAGPDAQSVDAISGTFFHDANVNGLQDDGEPALDGWEVFLDQDDNGVLDTDELSTTTDSLGRYEFTGVAANTYSVRAVAQTGWTLTTPLENSLSATSFGEGLFDQTQAVATGDFNEDSNLDIAVTHGEYVSLLKNHGDGTFEAWQEISVGAGAYALVAGDFNQDGALDLAVANYYASTLSILLNQDYPPAPFTSAITTAVGSLPRSITTGQFNDDNHDGQIDDNDYLDIAISHENGYSDVYVGDNQVSILLGNGDGTFLTPVYVAAGDSPVAIITAQFNDDNHDGWINERDAADLAVANLDSNDITVLLNNGSGVFSTGVPVPVSDASGGMPISVAVADLDRDGDVDLAVADLASDSVSILVNIGNGSFVRLPDALSAGTGPQALIAADLEGDGDFDLIVTNNTADHLGILRNYTNPATGEIEFGPLESSGVANFSGGPSYSVVADFFNADSTLDLAVAIGETSLRVGSGDTDSPQNYVSILLNDVFEGAHHITVTGIEPVPELNFGVRPEGNLPAVVGRHIFYNNSYYDGDDPSANAADDTAIATDKKALLPGELATFANYTSYTHGINGIMIDEADPAGTATIDDFFFLVGNSSNLSDWTTLAAPDLPTVTVRAGAGVGGSDRITLTWPDNTIEQQWLQVIVLASGNLGLVEDDVFYFGNAIGDSGEGNPSGVATTFISDELGARNNPHNFLDRAPVDDAYDYNRDSIVFISDELIARNNQTNFLTGLKLITAPASAPLAMSASYVESDEVAEAASSQQAEVDEYVDASMEDTDAAWIYYDWFDELDRVNNTHDEDTEETESLIDFLAKLPPDFLP